MYHPCPSGITFPIVLPDQSTLANDAFLQDFFGLNLAVIVPSNTPTNPVGDSNQGTEHAVDGDNDLNLSLADVLVDEAAPFVGAVLLRQPRSMNADDVEDVQEPDENVTAEENPCSSTVIRNPAAVTTPLADVTFSGQQAASQRASCRSHHNLSSIYLSSLGSAGTRVQPVDVSDFGISPIFAALNASSETTSRDCNPLDMSLARKAVARRKLELALALAQANTSPALPPRPRAPTVDDGPSTPPPVGIPTNAREDIDRGPRQDEHTDWHPLVGVPPSLEDCGEDTLQNIDPMQRSVMVEPFLALEACGSTARVPPACGLEDCFDENPVVTPVFAGPPVGVVGKVCGPTHQQDNQDSELHVSSPLPVAVTTHTQHDSGHSTKPIQHTDAFCGVEAFSGRRHKARRRMHQNPHKVCVGCAVS